MDPFEQLWGQQQTAGPGPLTMQLLKRFEGFTPVAKWDVRQYSGGYGSRAQPGERFTPETAEARLAQEVAPVNSWLDKNVKVPLTPERRAAFNSFGYNLGTDDLDRLLPDINRGDWPTVGHRMLSFNKADGVVNNGLVNRRRQEAALVTGGAIPEMPAAQENRPMPMPQQPRPLSAAMSGNSMVPGIFGGGDEPGYFGRLFQDPTFLMGASVLGAGLSGRDAGSALSQGAQAAAATSEMGERRRRAIAFQKMFGGGQPNADSPLLKGLPAEVLPLIQSMGPEEGMKFVGQLAMKKLTGKQVAVAPPGSTFYDPETGAQLGQAPSESPYAKELGVAQAKADVKQGQASKAGQQMLDLTDRMISLAGQPGTPERENFNNATGPIQGTDWYQGIKGFLNSKAETPQVYRNMQQELGTIKLLAARAYLSGEGQVTDNERRMVADAVGNVESAPSADAAVQAMQNLKGIITQVFMKPQSGAPVGQPGGAPLAAAGTPSNMAMPGVAVQGGAPAEQPQLPAAQAQPAPGGTAPPAPAIELLRQNPAPEVVQQFNAKYGEGAAQQALAGGQSPAPAAPVDKGAFSAPRPNGPNIFDKWVLKAGAKRKPELIDQYNAAFGPGEAEKVLGPANAPLGLGRGSYRVTR